MPVSQFLLLLVHNFLLPPHQQKPHHGRGFGEVPILQYQLFVICRRYSVAGQVLPATDDRRLTTARAYRSLASCTAAVWLAIWTAAMKDAAGAGGFTAPLKIRLNGMSLP
jgi:hypothetical protein